MRLLTYFNELTKSAMAPLIVRQVQGSAKGRLGGGEIEDLMEPRGLENGLADLGPSPGAAGWRKV